MSRSPPEGPTHELLERAQAAPESVDASDIIESVEADEMAEETALRTTRAVVESAPDRVGVMARGLEPYLEHADDGVRSTATRLVIAVTRIDPDAVVPLVPALVGLLDDEYVPVQSDVLTALADVAEVHPGNEDIHEAVSQLESLLADEYVHVREGAAEIAVAVAATHPEAVADLVPALVELVGDYRSKSTDGSGALTAENTPVNLGRPDEVRRSVEREIRDELQRERLRAAVIRETAARTLIPIAEADPSTIADSLPELFDVLRNDRVVATRTAVLEASLAVADARPGAIAAGADTVAGLLREEEFPNLQGAAARVLAVVADTCPEAVADAVAPQSNVDAETVAGLLEADSVAVRGAVASLLAYVAEYRPDKVGRVRPALVGALDDEYPSVRGSAVWALQFVGGETARTALRRVAETDPDPAIAQLAAEALDHSSQRE